MAPFKSSLARSAGKLLGVFKERDLSLRGDIQSSRVPPPPPVAATGGNQTVTPGNGYKYHTFTSPGTFAVTDGGACEFILVGGGGGGVCLGGGGGAGGLVYAPVYTLISNTNYAISIGGGGSAGSSGPRISGQGTPSTITGPETITANGGGKAEMQAGGFPGGSGGGGTNAPGNPIGTATQPGANPGISGLLQYGFPGGESNPPSAPSQGGGGGGAGGAGGAFPSPRDGGDGRQYPQFIGPLIGVPALNPLNGYFAGGGGGGNRDSAPGATSGGAGGGGNGGNSATDGTANSGGGGGGGRFPAAGHAGGSGIVVIRYSV